MNKHKLSLGMIMLAGALLLGATGCGSPADPGPNDKPITKNDTPSSSGVTAKGSTFIQAFLSKTFDEVDKKNNFQINYTGGGSSEGIKGVSDGTIPFGASDVPMTVAEESASTVGPILNIPLILGTAAIVYNIPDVKTGLKLDGPLLADIFMCKVTNWNDPRIAALNPGTKLPDLAISVQVRSDGSGTTYMLSDYLSKVSPEWKTTMGVNKKLKWSDKAQAWKQSEGVATQTKQIPGSITYVELSWATKSGLAYAALKNQSGNFVLPEAKGATAAAAAVPLPEDFKVSIVNAPGADSYPISSYSFGLVPEDLLSQKDNGRKIIDALKYVINDGQQFAEGLGYAKLPDSAVKAVQASLDKVKVQ